MADSQKIDIVAVDGKSALKEFIEFPFGLYRGNANWVAPLRIAVKDLLNREKHPFYKNAEAEFFLSRRDGKTVGRIAAIVDRNHNKFHNEKAGFFGFFECVDDLGVAQALLQRARQWTAERGAEFLRGPVNPSTNYECGILVDGFDSDPKVMMTYNPTYYPGLLERAGLRKAKDLFAYGGLAPQVDVRKIERVANKAMAKHEFKIRPIDVKNFDAEVMRVWEIYNSAWSVNWGFIPMSREEFVLMGKEMKQILKPELVLLGEVKGRVVGFALALPNVNHALKKAEGSLLPTGLLKILYHQRLIKDVRVIALGVTEEYRTTGVAAGFYATLVRNALKLGYDGECEMSWILEDNTLMNRSAELMGVKRYKTYRIYEWN